MPHFDSRKLAKVVIFMSVSDMHRLHKNLAWFFFLFIFLLLSVRTNVVESNPLCLKFLTLLHVLPEINNKNINLVGLNISGSLIQLWRGLSHIYLVHSSWYIKIILCVRPAMDWWPTLHRRPPQPWIGFRRHRKWKNIRIMCPLHISELIMVLHRALDWDQFCSLYTCLFWRKIFRKQYIHLPFTTICYADNPVLQEKCHGYIWLQPI